MIAARLRTLRSHGSVAWELRQMMERRIRSVSGDTRRRKPTRGCQLGSYVTPDTGRAVILRLGPLTLVQRPPHRRSRRNRPNTLPLITGCTSMSGSPHRRRPAAPRHRCTWPRLSITMSPSTCALLAQTSPTPAQLPQSPQATIAVHEMSGAWKHVALL